MGERPSVCYLRNLVAAFSRHPEAKKIRTFPDWTALRNRLILQVATHSQPRTKTCAERQSPDGWKQAIAEQDRTGVQTGTRMIKTSCCEAAVRSRRRVDC
jgi:hypothetical protein